MIPAAGTELVRRLRNLIAAARGRSTNASLADGYGYERRPKVPGAAQFTNIRK